MDRRDTVFTAHDVQQSLLQVYLIPTQADQFGYPQTVAIGDQDQGGIALAVAARRGPQPSSAPSPPYRTSIPGSGRRHSAGARELSGFRWLAPSVFGAQSPHFWALRRNSHKAAKH